MTKLFIGTEKLSIT